MLSLIIITLIKIVVGTTLITSAICEWSDRFKDGLLSVSIRYVLLVACTILLFKIPLIASVAIGYQVLFLLFTVLTALFVHNNILMKQINIPKCFNQIPKMHQSQINIKN